MILLVGKVGRCQNNVFKNKNLYENEGFLCYNAGMTWALKRQITYILIIFLFFSILGFFISYPYLNKKPTCNDQMQNGDESGVDCGGSCALACLAEVDQISLLWSRVFKVVPGRYNAVAYLENKNINTAIYKIKYRFRFADENNVYIGKREGETSIPPAGAFAIFEPAVDLGSSVPVYTTFEFTETPVWVKVPKERVEQINFTIRDITLINEDTSPALYAKITNNSLFIVPDLNVVTILYDELGNAVSASRTYLDSLRAEESADINFTWPEAFTSKVVNKEIIPMFNIFNVKLN